MLCKKVIPLLSEFFDGALDPDAAVQVSQHIGCCIRCRKEFDSLAALHDRLRSLDRVEAPEYLRSLVQHRLTGEPWRARVRNELERCWSIIRATEAMWYATRALGTIMASMFFIMISSAINPLYTQADAPVNTTGWACLRPEVGASVLKKLGMPQLPVKKAGRSGPAEINDLYLLEYGQREGVVRAGKNDTLSLLAAVDRSGAGKVQTVLEYPADKTLLNNFSAMVSSARYRPASENGQAVPSHLVFTFSKIFVSD